MGIFIVFSFSLWWLKPLQGNLIVQISFLFFFIGIYLPINVDCWFRQIWWRVYEWGSFLRKTIDLELIHALIDMNHTNFFFLEN
jgi:hypothetical protein